MENQKVPVRFVVTKTSQEEGFEPQGHNGNWKTRLVVSVVLSVENGDNDTFAGDIKFTDFDGPFMSQFAVGQVYELDFVKAG